MCIEAVTTYKQWDTSAIIIQPSVSGCKEVSGAKVREST